MEIYCECNYQKTITTSFNDGDCHGLFFDIFVCYIPIVLAMRNIHKLILCFVKSFQKVQILFVRLRPKHMKASLNLLNCLAVCSSGARGKHGSNHQHDNEQCDKPFFHIDFLLVIARRTVPPKSKFSKATIKLFQYNYTIFYIILQILYFLGQFV